jgi:hypothetical protein
MWRSFAFIACMGGAHALKMEQGLFPGRVGDIVFTQQPAAEQRTHLVLLGAGAQAGPSTMPETAVAPLAAHIAGALPTAFEAALPDVAVHVAAPTPALLTLALEGLTLAELRADAADFARIGGLVDGGHAVQLEASFAPRDRVAAAVCRATGATPASHGVPSKAWLDPSGELVAAFTAGKRETASRVASVADVVGQASGGRALILSVSSDAQLAAAAGACAARARFGVGWRTARGRRRGATERGMRRCQDWRRLCGERQPALTPRRAGHAGRARVAEDGAQCCGLGCRRSPRAWPSACAPPGLPCLAVSRPLALARSLALFRI